jgi:hypothetical protein
MAMASGQATCAVRAAPAAYSNTLRGVTVSQGKGITTVSGREYAAGANAYSSANTQLTDAIIHHPAFYATAALGNMCRSFREYRWNSIKVTYLGVCATSTNGWVQIVTTQDVQDAAYVYSSNTDLLQRSMSTQNAILGNVWENLEHQVPYDKKWCLTQPFLGEDVRDHIAGETYIYTQQASVSGALGLCVIDYSVSFRDLDYTMHTAIPFAQYQPLTLVDSSATPTANNIVQLTNATITAGSAGSVWKLIAMADQSTAATGTTLANAWKLTIDGTATAGVPIKNGSTFYGLVISTTIKLYPTFEAAKLSDSDSFIEYLTTGSSAGSFVFMAARVTLGPLDAISNV